jgi:hypothetical protein
MMNPKNTNEQVNRIQNSDLSLGGSLMWLFDGVCFVMQNWGNISFCRTSSPPTPDRGRGWNTGLRLERSWRLELLAGQALGVTPCSQFGGSGRFSRTLLLRKWGIGEPSAPGRVPGNTSKRSGIGNSPTRLNLYPFIVRWEASNTIGTYSAPALNMDLVVLLNGYLRIPSSWSQY